MNHQLHDRRSLDLHRLVAEKIRRDPSAWERAKQILDRWRSMGPSRSMPYFDRWAQLMSDGVEPTLEFATEVSEHATAMRQCSPLACVLSPEERSLFLQHWSPDSRIDFETITRLMQDEATDGPGRLATMKVFLDDERIPPPGWVLCRWPDEVIALIEAGGVEVVSLDHDLGDDERGTGYDVIAWIEEAVATRGLRPPKLAVHSANPAARERMLRGIEAIERLTSRR